MFVMSEVKYYESSDSQIIITDRQFQIFRSIFTIDDIASGGAFAKKRDQTLPVAFAIVGITCILLGKIRAGEITQIADIEVLFQATNYFELTGFILALVALLMALPQKDEYYIEIQLRDGGQRRFLLIEKKYFQEVKEIDQAIIQALRFANYRRVIS